MSRAAPSGINKDIADKKAAKYPTDYEREARKWMEEILKRPLANQEVGSQHFAECLKNGVDLCELINILLQAKGQPIIKKVNTSTMAFKQMENIGNFLKFAENYGVPSMSLFQTVDLYEERDVGMVVMCLFALAGVARKNNFPIKWGIAVTDANKREFSEETLAAGKGVISQQAGYNKGATQAGSGGFGNTRKL